jgi:argininosuccinate synthase
LNRRLKLLFPEIEVIAPIREMKLSRQQEIDFFERTWCGRRLEKIRILYKSGNLGDKYWRKETLTSNLALPEHAYLKQLSKTEPENIELQFGKGEIIGVNGEIILDKIKLINKIEEIASAFAIGRDVHLGDTIIGIKGRVGFEAAAAVMIIKAHHALEKHVLSKWQLHYKEQLAITYGMMLHESQYFEPVMRDIEAFLEHNQLNVTGKVFVKLMPYHFQIEGIESKFDLMNSQFGNYGEENKSWTAEDVIGFTNIMSNQMKIHYQINNEAC